MTTIAELENGIAEIDTAHDRLTSERRDILAQTHPADPEAKKRIAEIDGEIITIMNKRGDLIIELALIKRAAPCP